jgi:hypothetical protein
MTLSNMDMQSSIADELVAFANRLAQDNPDADPWEIADGLLSGAVHWWLYANAPCSDPACPLQELVREMAETSDYYHSPNDENVAHA